MIVYRIEHPKDRRGPWHHGAQRAGTNRRDRSVAASHDMGMHKPTPWMDWPLANAFEAMTNRDAANGLPIHIKGKTNPALTRLKYKFGFRTMRQLHSWFSPSELQILADAGFKLYVFDVPSEHVILGDEQLAFKRRHVRRSKTVVRELTDISIIEGVANEQEPSASIDPWAPFGNVRNFGARA